jgi:hypothetical protein
MKSLRLSAVVAVAGLATLFLAGSARAQFRPGVVRPGQPFVQPAPFAPGFQPINRRPIIVPPNVLVNPNYYLTPTLTVSQAAYNISVLGRAYSTLPPWMFGYNPYPPAIFNYGPAFPQAGFTPFLNTGFGPGANPYLFYNPYFAAMGFLP